MAESCGVPDILSESLDTPPTAEIVFSTAEGVTVDMRVVAYLSLVVRVVEQARVQAAIAEQVPHSRCSCLGLAFETICR